MRHNDDTLLVISSIILGIGLTLLIVFVKPQKQSAKTINSINYFHEPKSIVNSSGRILLEAVQYGDEIIFNYYGNSCMVIINDTMTSDSSSINKFLEESKKHKLSVFIIKK